MIVYRSSYKNKDKKFPYSKWQSYKSNFALKNYVTTSKTVGLKLKSFQGSPGPHKDESKCPKVPYLFNYY